MRVVFLLALIALVLSNPIQWAQYKLHQNKIYQSAEEEAHRLECFLKNMKIIDDLNAKGSAKHGMNEFTDLCPEEFKIFHSLQIKPKPKALLNLAQPFSAGQVALAANQTVDWRTKGAVTPVKNQGMCGSCWSFSATGNMEGQHFMKTGKLVALSEEELVGCSSSAGNLGCNGGLMDNAFQWVINNKGIDSEADYPYKSGSGNTPACIKKKSSTAAATFSSYIDLPNDEEKMAQWVSKNGPLSIAVDASNGWQTYSGGIINDCNGSQLDHGVLIVGYGTEHDTPYWIIKNSWGATWGENGYIRLEFGTNQCALNSAPSSIVV